MTFSLPQTFEWEFRESVTGKFLPGIYLDCKWKDASGAVVLWKMGSAETPRWLALAADRCYWMLAVSQENLWTEQLHIRLMADRLLISIHFPQREWAEPDRSCENLLTSLGIMSLLLSYSVGDAITRKIRLKWYVCRPPPVRWTYKYLRDHILTCHTCLEKNSKVTCCNQQNLQ